MSTNLSGWDGAPISESYLSSRSWHTVSWISAWSVSLSCWTPMLLAIKHPVLPIPALRRGAQGTRWGDRKRRQRYERRPWDQTMNNENPKSFFFFFCWFYSWQQPAVDDDWPWSTCGFCAWLGIRWKEGLPVGLYFFHHEQQRSGALWDVVIRPGSEPIMSDRTMLWSQLRRMSW